MLTLLFSGYCETNDTRRLILDIANAGAYVSPTAQPTTVLQTTFTQSSKALPVILTLDDRRYYLPILNINYFFLFFTHNVRIRNFTPILSRPLLLIPEAEGWLIKFIVAFLSPHGTSCAPHAVVRLSLNRPSVLPN